MEEQKFELDLRMSDKGIVCNATTLKAMLPEKLKTYNYVVDAENYDDAKKDRTKLNDLYDLLQKKRMQFEETELAGWKSEKSILMEIEKTIKEAANTLGDGIKAIDEEDKIAKMERIRENFNALELPLPITFEQLYDRSDYDKKTMTDKKIIEDMQKKINKIIEDNKLMALFLPKDLADQEQVKQVYCKTFSLTEAQKKAEQLIKIRQQVTQKKQQVETKPSVAPMIQKQNISKTNQPSPNSEQLYTRTFRVVDCARQQIIDLGNYMNANGIKFEKVEDK